MFEFIVQAFNAILYQPLFNFLVILYNYLPGHDFGMAVIILTVLIRLALYPSSVKAIKTQKAMSEIQPKIKELQKKYKDDKEKQMRETMALYKEANISPFSSLFTALIQFPLLIAIYRVFWNGLNPNELSVLYSFVANPGQISASFLGLLDLSQPNVYIAILAGIVQFWQTKTSTPANKKSAAKDGDFASIMQRQMLYVFPVLTIVILFKLPSALGLYWVVGSLFLIGQQYMILKKHINSPK